MVIVYILAALFLITGILVIMGKGDNLIAGYNTASEEERAAYNIKRLRGLVGGLLVAEAPMMCLLGKESMTSSFSFTAFTLVACIVVVILANTWAKNKSE